MHNDNRLAVVTGASSGIGQAVSRHLELRRVHVLRVSRQHGVDVTDVSAVEDVYRAALQPPSLLVAAAGIIWPQDWLDLSATDFDRVLQTNVMGTFNVVQAHVRRLREAQQSGRIVLFGSPSALRPSGGNLAYGVSKAAVEAMGLGLARELEPDRIKVYILRPDHVDTPMLRSRGFNHLDAYPLITVDALAVQISELLLTPNHLDGQVICVGGSVLGKQR